MVNCVTIVGDVTADQIRALLAEHLDVQATVVTDAGAEESGAAFADQKDDDKSVLVSEAEIKEDDVPEVIAPARMAETVAELRKETNRLRYDMNVKSSECKELEQNMEKTLSSIKTFHLQQQQLFDEFVVLRAKYDEQKKTLLHLLWHELPKTHHRVKSIPACDFDIRESQHAIGDYRVHEALGDGQFATVHRCTKTMKDYALKIIQKDQITSFSSLRRIANELDVLNSLDCSGIVRLFDVMHSQSSLYIVTELGGRDLFEFFDDNDDGVEPEVAQQVLSGVLHAIRYCHGRGICHRDIKPENILVEVVEEPVPAGSAGTAAHKTYNHIKICDFGLSVRVPALPDMLHDFCGSPGFFAPEMALREAVTAPAAALDLSPRQAAMSRSKGYDGFKADVWSIGCVLLEMVLGHHAFISFWMAAYNFNILEETSKFLRAIEQAVSALPVVLKGESWAGMVDAVADVAEDDHEELPDRWDGEASPELADFIRKALALKPADRPSLAELCEHPWIADSVRELEGKSRTNSDASGIGGVLSPLLSPRSAAAGSTLSARSTNSQSNVFHLNNPPPQRGGAGPGTHNQQRRSAEDLARASATNNALRARGGRDGSLTTRSLDGGLPTSDDDVSGGQNQSSSSQRRSEDSGEFKSGESDSGATAETPGGGGVGEAGHVASTLLERRGGGSQFVDTSGGSPGATATTPSSGAGSSGAGGAVSGGGDEDVHLPPIEGTPSAQSTRKVLQRGDDLFYQFNGQTPSPRTNGNGSARTGGRARSGSRIHKDSPINVPRSNSVSSTSSSSSNTGGVDGSNPLQQPVVESVTKA